jgi:hypothetical protein
VEKDVLSGYPDGTFKPEASMSKVEFYSLCCHQMSIVLDRKLFE